MNALGLYESPGECLSPRGRNPDVRIERTLLFERLLEVIAHPLIGGVYKHLFTLINRCAVDNQYIERSPIQRLVKN